MRIVDRLHISVVVCTYNRAEMLGRVLQSLIEQTLDKRQYEIVVINNASTDSSARVVRDFRDKHPDCSIVLAREDRQGLGYARNAGLHLARGRYVAFIDDDAVAGAKWLDLVLDCFERMVPTPLAVGGPIAPLYDAPRPKWFKDDYEIRTWGKEPRFLKKGESFSGSNMIFRKEILEEYGGFDLTVGMKGPLLSVGEETHLFEKIWKGDNNPILYYRPDLWVFHAVPAYKMTISYPLKRALIEGQTWYQHNGPVLLSGRLKFLPRIIFSFAKLSALSLLRLCMFPAIQNWAVESCAPLVKETGRFLGCLGWRVDVRQR